MTDEVPDVKLEKMSPAPVAKEEEEDAPEDGDVEMEDVDLSLTRAENRWRSMEKIRKLHGNSLPD